MRQPEGRATSISRLAKRYEIATHYASSWHSRQFSKLRDSRGCSVNRKLTIQVSH
jgi:hypothetical protein